jgi:large subunit ribosomal protein L3
MAMKEGLIGRKRGMTQVFGEDGNRIPVTVVEAGPCTVVGVRTQPTHGYDALQIGFQPEPKKGRVTKPMAGHYKKAGITTPMKVLREVRLQKTENVQAYQVGQTLTVDLFTPGEFVDVVGETKGKGFQGGVKRHGWSGGDATHGSMFHRAPGSIGASSIPRASGPVIISPGAWVETAAPC